MSYTTVDTLWGHILVYVVKLLILFCENAELNYFNSFVHTREAVKDKAVPHKEIYHNAIQKKKKQFKMNCASLFQRNLILAMCKCHIDGLPK